jgi:hypothetical protein
MWTSDELTEGTVHDHNVTVNHLNCDVEKILKNFRVDYHKPYGG